jgi:hypothetical protein
MLLRSHSEGVLLIAQPAHAWISGQIARAWGNERFGDFTPRAEVELAAELHDLGFIKWEQSPTLDEATGLPHTFLSLPLEEHLEIWSQGIHEAGCYGRYPALLVSMHYTWLAQTHPHYETPANASLVQEFLDTQAAFQSFAFNSLRRDAHFSRAAELEAFTRNRRLLSLWDWLSLQICMGITAPETIKEVPDARGLSELVLSPHPQAASHYTLSPWPFRTGSLTLGCESRVLSRKFKSTAELRSGWQNAPHLALQFELTPK